MTVARFYDPKDERELERVESILRHGGIEYAVRRYGGAGGTFREIQVAEEDLPRAEELLVQ
jgi:hypothetical protein